MSNDYAAVVSFPEKAVTYEAYSKLTTSIDGVAQAAVVEREDNGALRITDASDPRIGAGFTGGSLVGVLVGILGGPLGMLLGWATGASIGSLVDMDRAETSDDVLSDFGRQIPTGGTALILQGTEQSLPAVEALVKQLGGAITSRPVDEVIDEIEAEQDAAAQAAAAARKSLREQKRDERKERWDERWDDIKDRFRGDDKKAES